MSISTKQQRKDTGMATQCPSTLMAADYLALSEPNLSYYHNKECHVCYERVPEEKSVTCCNGHTCCQKHHLERIRAIYQEGQSAYGGAGSRSNGHSGEAHGQMCFMCRCPIGDARFSVNFFKLLKVIQAVEIPKMYGHDVRPEIVMEVMPDSFVEDLHKGAQL